MLEMENPDALAGATGARDFANAGNARSFEHSNKRPQRKAASHVVPALILWGWREATHPAKAVKTPSLATRWRRRCS